MNRLDTLHDEMGKIRSAVDAISETAATEQRDLNDNEQHDVDTLLARAEAIRPELDKLVATQRSLTAASDVLARTAAPAKIETDFSGMTAGEYISLYVRAQEGDAEASKLFRAVAENKSTDGIIPQVITGNVIKFADDARPVFNSFSARPMPNSGKSFDRPRITQRVLVGETNGELVLPDSQKFTMTLDTVQRKVVKGALQVSQETIDWTEPALLDLAIADFAGVYAAWTEAEACAYLASTVSASAGWVGTNIGTVVASVLDAVEAVYGTAKRMPDTLWLSLDEMLDLAGMTNTNNDVTAMQLIRTALAEAGVPMRVVTGPQLSANTRIVGNSGLIESYENSSQLLRAVNVPLIGWDIAYYGQVAFNGYAQGFCKLV